MKTELRPDVIPEPKSELDFIDSIVKRYEGEEGMLIPMLQDIQAEYGYLPADHLRSLSRALKVPLARIYGVATFYASFRLSPKGQHDVTLCMGTVCYLKGSARISEVIREEYGVEPGGTTSDRLFTLNLVNCVGACALAPVMIVDGKYHDAMTPESALKILRGLSSEEGEIPGPEPAKTREPAKASERAMPPEPPLKAAEDKGEASAAAGPAGGAVSKADIAPQEKPAVKIASKMTSKREVKTAVKKQAKKTAAASVKKTVRKPIKASGKKSAPQQASERSSKKKAGKK
jgi:NADH-quinone oxidoreductase subunit E